MNTPPRRDEQYKGCIDTRQYDAAVRRDMLARDPRLVREAIALHYLDCAAYAAQLNKMLEMTWRAPSNDNPEADEIIDCIVQKIHDLHVERFGTPPPWSSLVVQPEEPERPERSHNLNYVGGGYAKDSHGCYREAFWAGTP